ncbi:tetratricopeptide repeat protein [Streptomyces formicae]|uniref:Regulatory protein n=1 Tax=Streptomyces formicae TaxID=1616117 RepID=A0A291QAS7_9ACTN|nr:tetratricopeptide repeat protein [Streptomyces formicae]ATL28658.1 regulatory protein [Streptomyces formicae]
MTHNVENHIDGGVLFGFVVQGQHVTLTLPDRPDPALAGLPPASVAFAGRRSQLDRVLAALDPTAPNDRAVTVAVTGLAGTGKTELLLQVAHRALREKGWFPGGVLYVDLHGYDVESRLSPKRALGTLLRALGVPPQHIPNRVEERANACRSALDAFAGAGRRVLVVLDDVPVTDKIRHLLPSDGRTATLLSARHSLAGLDALALTLRELPADEGRDLLGKALVTALPEDSRVADEPDDADQLVALCGGLPLALRIVASLLVDVPTRPLSHLRREIQDAHSRLSLLSREERAVAAAFELSYRRLTDEQARFFRLMCLHPGPDFSTEAAARLYGEGRNESERLLEDLVRRHLVEPRESYGRWQLHSLVQLYAWERLRSHGDPWDEDRGRLFAHFHEMATQACERVFDPAAPQPTASSCFRDRAEALRWLEAERRSLVAVVDCAHEVGSDPVCAALAAPVAHLLAAMRYLEDAEEVLITGIRSSRRCQDGPRRAALLSSLGVVLLDQRRLGKSFRTHLKAIKMFRRMQQYPALADALNNLGLTLHEQRKFEEAVATHTEAAQLSERVGDGIGVARALSSIGETQSELGRRKKAARALRKSAKIFRKEGDLRGYARALSGLARATRDAGKAEQALELHKRALEMSDGLLLPHDRAIELANYAGTLIAAGELDAALTAQQEALDTFRRLGESHGEATALGGMALVRHSQGKWSKAVRLHTLALEALVESRDDHRLAHELRSLAEVLLRQGSNSEALENLELAVELYHRTGDTRRATETLAQVVQVRKRHGVIARTA